jgi:hypothetical protein
MKKNHRRGGTTHSYPVDAATGRRRLNNGTLPPEDKPWRYIDKSISNWGRTAALADVRVQASIGNDFTDGHRGMAKAVRGAKKFVRTRVRFHENSATRKLARELPSSDEDA